MSAVSNKQGDRAEAESKTLYTRGSLRLLDAIKDQIGEAILKRATDLASEGGRDLVTVQDVDAATDEFFLSIERDPDVR